MRIGVIGVGAIGGTLARKWAAAGQTVRVANSRGAEAVRDFAAEIGAQAADIRGAVEGAEVVLLAMPFPAVASLPADLFDRAAPDVAIVDAGNYYPDIRDDRIAGIDAGLTESVWVARQLGRPIFKAFNAVLFHTLSELGAPKGSFGRLAIPVAGDDAAGKQRVMALVDVAGFDPVDAGSLEGSWRQQACTPAYCCDYGAEDVRRGLAAALKGKAAPLLTEVWFPGFLRIMEGGRSLAEMHPEIIALNRSLNPL